MGRAGRRSWCYWMGRRRGRGERYMKLGEGGPIELLDAKGNRTGILLVQEMHTPNIQKETDTFQFSQAKIVLQYGAGGPTELVLLDGPTEVQVCIPPNGLAADTDGNGLDQVPTLMTLLDLQGNSSKVPVEMTLDPSQPTKGRIEETANPHPGTLDLPPFEP